MRLSELSSSTGVSTASLKYYLRESLLAPGETISKTQAEYGPAHVERVRLIRALVDSGGLSLAQVRQVLATLDGPQVPRHELYGVGQAALTATTAVDADPDWTALATAFVEERGWLVQQDDPLLPQLGAQLKAAAEICQVGGTETLHQWADGMEIIADADIATITEDESLALRTVVVGTVLTDRVLQSLRRLAQQDRSARTFGETQTSSPGPASRR